MDNLDADIERARRVDHTLSLLPVQQQRATRLRDIDISPCSHRGTCADIARDHAHEMLWTIRLLLRRLGVWGRDWRLAELSLVRAGLLPGAARAGLRGHDGPRRRDRDFLSFEWRWLKERILFLTRAVSASRGSGAASPRAPRSKAQFCAAPGRRASSASRPPVNGPDRRPRIGSSRCCRHGYAGS